MSLYTVVWLIISAANLVYGEPVHLHLQSDVVISDYEGPLTKEMLQFITKAEVLEIRQSHITKIEGELLAHLTKLEKISFINCTIDIEGVDVERMFHGATSLREFIARHITCKNLRAEALRQTKIESFAMTDNVYPKLMDNMFNETNLKKLDLSRNHMEDIAEGAFNGLDKLEILDLSTNKLKDIPKTIMAPLKSLKSLKLRENLWTAIDIAQVADLPNLVTADLAHNPITEMKLDGVEKLHPHLKTVDITGTQLTEAQIKELREKHPTINFKTE